MGTVGVVDPLLLLPVCWVGFNTCLWLVVVVVYMKKFHEEENEAPEDGQVYGNSDSLADAAEDETSWVPEQSFATEGALEEPEEQPERMCVSLESVLVMALEFGCTGQPEDDSAEAVKQQEGLAAAAEPEQQIEVVVPDDFFFGVAAKNRMPKLVTAFDAKPQPMPRLYTAFGREYKLA